MKKSKKSGKHDLGVLEGACADCGGIECQCGSQDCGCYCHDCNCCGSDGSCGNCVEPMAWSKEAGERQLTDAASDVWMKLFLEACEKEWRKKAKKSIQKLAVEHVKKSEQEWKQKMK